MTRPAQCRELAEKTVAMKRVSIALACREFGVSENGFRYSPKCDDENERIADLLVGLTNVHKTWGFGLCFLHLQNLKGRAIVNRAGFSGDSNSRVGRSIKSKTTNQFSTEVR